MTGLSSNSYSFSTVLEIEQYTKGKERQKESGKNGFGWVLSSCEIKYSSGVKNKTKKKKLIVFQNPLLRLQAKSKIKQEGRNGSKRISWMS